ncbi:MAG: acyltransferase [Alphaproteobacteria bacterium]|nr:acyltransferase [Alphaproteobacteria bacterium]
MESLIRERFVPYKINGENNRIFIIENGEKHLLSSNEGVPGLDIVINGNNNSIAIEAPNSFTDTLINIKGDNCTFSCGSSDVRYQEAVFLLQNSNFVKIGRNVLCSPGFRLYAKEKQNSGITIGDDCFFAVNTLIRNGDGHTLLDQNTGEILNEPEEIVLGSHIWVTSNCTILKGSYIADNCVVAAGSLINKKFEEEGCLLAGTPAKIIRRGINWDRRCFQEYISERE